MTSASKKQLIFECASEAVMRARIEIQHMQSLSSQHKRIVDEILSRAQHNAGRWAVYASEADTRTAKHHTAITGHNA